MNAICRGAQDLPATAPLKSVGYVLPQFPVLTETFVGVEMRAMQRLGHQVTPISLSYPQQDGQPRDEALAAAALYVGDCSRRQGWLTWLKNLRGWGPSARFALGQDGIRARSLLLQAAQVAALAQHRGCRHLHAHFALHSAAVAIAAARLIGVSCSFVGHGFDIYVSPADLRLKLSCADFSVAVCGDMERLFRSLSGGGAEIINIPCGVELERLPYQHGLGVRGRLLFVGRLTEKKGLRHLLDALASMPSAERLSLDIVGEGLLSSALRAQVDSLGLQEQVSFLGGREAEWISAAMTRYHALAAPFCEAPNGDRDTGPLVLKEAMAVGLPVVTTQFMGAAEIVRPDCGFLAAPGDSQSLACAIQRLLDTSDQALQKMVLNARRRVVAEYSSVRQARLLSLAIQGL
ncbi:glycosyltransferase [Hahella sp. KA22]|uniref:glycosyltransferase n=1 Tax=Hahella sp. KA22 TaxID=1628392 RepID=UPI000FDD098F|nr:glycosyltransferase [Hahella sp. KA22]AZZ92826.1 colanic acid biosynthesis glycosyltransferase WcaL [Hahella sp. KA22]QAY56200.1 glycosyltransferase [Hahella sp. KA22]